MLYKAAVETRSAKLAIAPPWITLLTFDNFSSTFISTKHEPWSSGALITFHLIIADLNSKKGLFLFKSDILWSWSWCRIKRQWTSFQRTLPYELVEFVYWSNIFLGISWTFDYLFLICLELKKIICKLNILFIYLK